MDKDFDLSQLSLFTGTEHYYRINRKCLLTDGTKYLAEGAGAFWLMDAAASYPIPNSEVKPLCADDSVAVCHVKVGHRQALESKSPSSNSGAFFCANEIGGAVICVKIESHLLETVDHFWLNWLSQ